MSKRREDFELKLKRLEEITARLESREMGLMESIEAYKEGVEIARGLIAILKDAERKIQLIQKEAISEFGDMDTFNQHIGEHPDGDNEK